MGCVLNDVELIKYIWIEFVFAIKDIQEEVINVYQIASHKLVDIIKYYIMGNVELVLMAHKLVEIIVCASKDIIMMFIIMFVIKLYKIVALGKFGMEMHVFVIMDLVDTMDNASNAHHQAQTKCVYAQTTKTSMPTQDNV